MHIHTKREAGMKLMTVTPDDGVWRSLSSQEGAITFAHGPLHTSLCTRHYVIALKHFVEKNFRIKLQHYIFN